MQGEFDPYYKWLGIPPSEQPPHYYRLLGVQPFEPDPDVISYAADQRMAILKTFSVSAHSRCAEDLLDEVSSARVCLLNPAKKAAYDGTLRSSTCAQSMPTKVPAAIGPVETIRPDEPPNTTVADSFQDNWPPIDSQPGHSSLEWNLVQPRRKQTRSPLAFILSVIFGGLAGLVAGYFVLCQISSKFDFLHVVPAKVGREAKIERQAPAFDHPVNRVAPSKDRGIAEDGPKQAPQEALQPWNVVAPKLVVPARRFVQPAPKPVVQVNKLPQVNKAPSAIVKLDLDKPVLRIVGQSDKAEIAMCDVGFSHNLLHRRAAAGGFVDVAKNLRHREKKMVELEADIQGAGAAIEITFIRQTNAVVCELRPMFSLPSGMIEPLTNDRWTALHNRLVKSLAAAKAARDSLPSLKSNLSQLQADVQATNAAMNDFGKAGAKTRLFGLNSQITAVNKKINSAQKLADRDGIITKDLTALEQIGEYAKTIANVSSIAVRFYANEETIPAETK
jgi:hypothetical protein